MVCQIKGQNVWIGYNEVALLQRIVAQGTGRRQNPGHPPHPFVGDKAARLVDPLPFAHLLRLVVKGQGNGVAPRVAHDAPRVAHVGHHQSSALRYRYDRCGAGKGCLRRFKEEFYLEMVSIILSLLCQSNGKDIVFA